MKFKISNFKNFSCYGDFITNLSLYFSRTSRFQYLVVSLSLAVNLYTKQNIKKNAQWYIIKKINNSAKLVTAKNEIIDENSSSNRRPTEVKQKSSYNFFSSYNRTRDKIWNNSCTTIENNLPLSVIKIIFYIAIDK